MYVGATFLFVVVPALVGDELVELIYGLLSYIEKCKTDGKIYSSILIVSAIRGETFELSTSITENSSIDRY